MAAIVAGRGSLDGEVGLADHLSGTARGKKADVVLDETLCQVKKTSLVVDRQDGYTVSASSLPNNHAKLTNLLRRALDHDCGLWE